jgi:hypothetical protein
MATDTPHKPKMAARSDAPPGIEVDGHGNIIPFEDRTKGDKQKVRDNIAAAIHGEQSTDPAGKQGGTKGTGRG